MNVTECIGVNLAVALHLGKANDRRGSQAELADLYALAISQGNPFNAVLSAHWVELNTNLNKGMVFVEFNNWQMLFATFMRVMIAVKNFHFGAAAGRTHRWVNHDQE